MKKGLVENLFDVGDVTLGTRNSEDEITLRNVENAAEWYEKLRPVSSGSGPVETVDQNPISFMLWGAAWAALLVPIWALVLGVFLAMVVPLDALALLVVAGVVVGVAGIAAASWVQSKFTTFRFFDDHIERAVAGPWQSREFVHVDHINNVELSRSVLERPFGVGTVDIEARWYPDTFKLNNISRSKEIYDKLQQLT